MLEALIAGERDPAVLAGLARGKLKAKHGALVEALAGRFDDRHAELARMLLDQIDALGGQIGTLTTRIEELLAAIPAADGVDADGTTGPGAGSGPDAVVLPAVARLDEVNGIGPGTAQVIIAEIGLDMGVFRTPGHLVSWAKLSPRTLQSGATRRAGKTGKGNPYLKGVLGEAAAAAAKTDTFLGERYRRLVKRRGKLKALVAIARSILVIVWHLLADPTARYHDLGAGYYASRIDKDKKARNHIPQQRSRLRRLLPPTQSGLLFSGQRDRHVDPHEGRTAVGTRATWPSAPYLGLRLDRAPWWPRRGVSPHAV